MGFTERIQQAVLLFRERVQDGSVLVIYNQDTDGIASAAILSAALMSEHISFSLHPVKQLSPSFLEETHRTDYNVIIFADVGSNMIHLMDKALPGKHIFIFDHHLFPAIQISENIVHVNPHLEGMQGIKDISASGICYFFACALHPSHLSLAPLALIGAVGDVQEDHGFFGLNRHILRQALDAGLIEIREGIRIFGAYTKPLYQVLEQITHPFIPGVTGSAEAAKRFLENHDIAEPGKGGSTWLHDLDDKEVHTLLQALHCQDSIRGPVYFLTHEPEHQPFREIKEYSTLLNACGKMGKPGLGVGASLGDPLLRKNALDVLGTYRRELIRALDWFYCQRGTSTVIEGKGYTVINAGNHIRDTIAGTIASLISKSNLYPDRTIIMSLAHTLEGELKISLRVSGFGVETIDVQKIAQDIVQKTGGYGGGHRLAAGAVIPQEKEELLLSLVPGLLSNYALEEHISPPTSQNL